MLTVLIILIAAGRYVSRIGKSDPGYPPEWVLNSLLVALALLAAGAQYLGLDGGLER